MLETDQGPWRGPKWDALMQRIADHARQYARDFPAAPRRPDGYSDNVGPSWMTAEWGHAQRQRL